MSDGGAGARPAKSEGSANAPAPATRPIPTHFYYLAATMLLIELAVALLVLGLIRPLSAL